MTWPLKPVVLCLTSMKRLLQWGFPVVSWAKRECCSMFSAYVPCKRRAWMIPSSSWRTLELELEILLFKNWSGILGATIKRTLWNQFSFFPLFYTEGFFYIPGGEAFLPTVGSCEDVLNLMYLMSGILFCEPPKIRFSWLDPPFFFFQTVQVKGVLRAIVGQWWQNTNMSTLQLSWAFILVKSLEFQLERGWFS